MDLGIRSAIIEGVPVLSLDGEADLASLPRLHDQVRRFISEHPGRHVVVDLDGLGYLDPVSVGVLVGARLQARASGGDLQLVCTSTSVATVFTGSGLDAAFMLHHSVAEAARSSAP